ncbi:nitroreductase family protein [Yoonia sp. 2307UL14-13]|uniref:nitroreductase family protein n=1 Tax=Yoonia sp. 2307UL14-13 TaxID=3126506 RepID=UPI0030B2738E
MCSGINTTLEDAIRHRRSVRRYSKAALSVEQVERILWAGQGITSEDGLRTVPSAHGLQPLRLVVVPGRVDGLPNGTYDVDRETNRLRQMHDKDVQALLRDAAVDNQTWIADAPLLVSICADYTKPCRAFADQKPYGRRGSRYVEIEAGAAAQNMMLMATNMGLGSVLVAGFDDDRTADALGLELPFSPVLHLCFGIALS